MDHVVGALVAVADAGTGGGQQLQQEVVIGLGDLGSQGGGNGGDGVLMIQLGIHGAQGGAGNDRGGAPAAATLAGAPAAQGHSHGGPVPAGQVAQAVVGQDVAPVLRADQGTCAEGPEHLVGAAGLWLQGRFSMLLRW